MIRKGTPVVAPVIVTKFGDFSQDDFPADLVARYHAGKREVWNAETCPCCGSELRDYFVELTEDAKEAWAEIEAFSIDLFQRKFSERTQKKKERMAQVAARAGVVSDNWSSDN